MFLTPESYALSTNPFGKDLMVKFLVRSSSTCEFSPTEPVSASNIEGRCAIRKDFLQCVGSFSSEALALCTDPCSPPLHIPHHSGSSFVPPSPQEILSALWGKRKALSLEESGKTCLELETSSHQIIYMQHPHVRDASGGGQWQTLRKAA